PLETIRRLVAFCCLGTSDEQIAKATASVKPELRHIHFDAGDLAVTNVATETISMYEQLCREAGFLDCPAGPANAGVGSRREVDLDALSYQIFLKDWRSLVENHTPEGARLAVVSKGDDELLELHNREAWHFPRAESGGAYAGCYPADSAEAIAHLEVL